MVFGLGGRSVALSFSSYLDAFVVDAIWGHLVFMSFGAVLLKLRAPTLVAVPRSEVLRMGSFGTSPTGGGRAQDGGNYTVPIVDRKKTI